MPDRHAAFVGTIPLIYDRYLGPLFFQPYADDLAARLVPGPGTRVLEVACGTGLVTRRLLDRLGGAGSILATDLATFFPDDPPQFYTIPFSCRDPAPVCRWLADAGFTDVTWTSVARTGTSPSAAEAAIGLIEGNPIGPAIVERRADAVPEIERAVAARIVAELGDHPVRAPLRAVVFSARRP